MTIVFMGSAHFSVPTLSALHTAGDLLGVVTQPDRRAGRGRRYTANPVKACATENDLPVLQPPSAKDPSFHEQLKAWSPDLVVVAAYGQILPQAVLSLPSRGCVNVHASLLPRWRGASPIQTAILEGDTTTGVTLMQMDAGMDTGPIIVQREVDILPDDTGDSLAERLASIGADLLRVNLASILSGATSQTPQDESKATYAPLLKKKDGILDFSLPAERLERQIRAYHSWPGSFFFWNETRIVVHEAHITSGDADSGAGLVTTSQTQAPAIQTATDRLVLDLVQPAGKQAMSGKAFLNGARGLLGDTLETRER
jgi:methionyl-tRNA formyltransferase